MKTAHDPAYPAPDVNKTRFIGLTKREYIAAMAMSGMMQEFQTSESHTNDISERIAARAVKCADELLKQLET